MGRLEKRVTSRMRLLLLPGNATFNRGDRGNLMAQIALLHASFPGVALSLPSFRPEVDARWYRAEVMRRPWLLSLGLIRELRRADALVWGGGALVADNAGRWLVPYWIPILFLARFVFRKPIMAWAHGVVLETALGRFLARFAFRMVDAVTLRDRNSLEAYEGLAIASPPGVLTCDPAILVRAGSRERGAEILAGLGLGKRAGVPLIGVTPTYWPFYHSSADWLPYPLARKWGLRATRRAGEIRRFNEALAEVVDLLVERMNADVLLLPRYAAAPWDDRRHLREVADLIRNSGRVRILESDEHCPEDYLSLWHHFDFNLTTALHDAMFSAALGVPCVQVCYEPKGLDFFREIGAEDGVLDLADFLAPGAGERILGMVREGVARWPDRQPAIRAEVSRLQERATQNARVLAELLATRSIPSPSGS